MMANKQQMEYSREYSKPSIDTFSIEELMEVVAEMGTTCSQTHTCSTTW